MAVRTDQLVYRAGGKALQRFGTLRKRSASFEEVVETFARASTGLEFDRNGILRQAEAAAVRVNFRDLDGDGVLETMTVPMEPALTNLCEFNIPGAGEAGFETQSLSGVTNLGAEYGIRIEEGDDYREAMPANFDPNSFGVAVMSIPDWGSSTTETHMWFEIALDSSNRIFVWYDGTNLLGQIITSGGTTTYDLSAATWSAGDELFIGARLTGGTATFYAGTTAGGSLVTDSGAISGSLSAGSYVAYVGQNRSAARRFEGAVNLLVTDDGSTADPITDRFNSGNGMALAGDDKWLKRHGENLVLHVGGNSDGSAVQMDSFSGATDRLDQTDGGRYLFDASSEEIDFGAFTEADGAVELVVFGEVEPDAGTNGGAILSQWDTGGAAAAKRHWNVRIGSSGNLGFEVATDGAGAKETYYGTGGGTGTDLAGQRFLFYVRFKGDEASNADKVQFGVAIYNATTKQYGAWRTDALGDASTPASLRTPSAVNLTGGNTDNAGSGDAFEGYIDDLRLIAGASGSVPSVAELQAFVVNEANPAHVDHWWPLDTDASDFIGSQNGSITGATLSDDGRHNIGGFHRFQKRGRWWFDGVDDEVDLGDVTALDGATAFSMFLVFQPEDLGGSTEHLFGRWGGSPNKQLLTFLGSGGKFTVWMSEDGSAESKATGGTTLSAGTRYAVWIRYAGDGATNSDKLKVALATYDPATGTWGSFTGETLAFTGSSIPSNLSTPTSRSFTLGNANGAPYEGFIDDVRLWVNDALDTADLDTLAVYDEADGQASKSVRAPDHWWTADATPNDHTYKGAGMGTKVRPTFARADTGRQFYADGVVRDVASGELRNKHQISANDGNDYLTALLERAFTNRNAQDDLTSWGTSAATGTVSGSVSDPAGGTAAYTVEDTDGAGVFHIQSPSSLTLPAGDGTKSVILVVKEGTSSEFTFTWEDDTAVARRMEVEGTWSGGNLSVNMPTGSLLATHELSDGWWVVWAQTSSGVVASNTNRLRFRPTNETASTTGTTLVWKMNAFDVASPSASVLDASEVTTADDLTVPLKDATPQEATYLYEGVVLDDPTAAGASDFWYLFNVGDNDGGGGSAKRIGAYHTNGGELYVNFSNGSSVVTGKWAAGTTAYGDHIALRVYQASNGALTLGLSVNGGAEASPGSSPGTQALPADWSNDRVSFANNASANSATHGLISFKGQSGSEQTLAQMQANDDPDIVHYVPGMQTADVNGTVTGALDWYDGRQPEGWNRFREGIDRSTDEASTGTWAMRLNDLTGADSRLLLNFPTTNESWVSYHAEGRRVGATGTGTITFSDSSGEEQPLGTPSADIPVQGSLGSVGIAARSVYSTGDGDAHARVNVSDGGDSIYVDNIRLYEYAVLSADTATKGNSFPALAGFGNARGVADASIISNLAGEADVTKDVFDSGISGQGQAGTKVTTGPSGTQDRSYVWGDVASLNGMTAGSWYSMVVGVWIPAGSAITAANVTLKAVDSVGSTTGESMSSKGEWTWLHVQRQIDGGATHAYFELSIEDGQNFGTTDAHVYLALPTIVAGRCRPVPIPNDAEGTVTKAAETHSDAFVVPSSKEITWYLRFVENGAAYAASESGLSRIDGGVGNPGLRIFAGGGNQYRIAYNDGSSTTSVTLTPNPTLGDEVEIRVHFVPSTGVVTVGYSVESAAEVTDSATGGADPDDWAAATILHGGAGSWEWVDEKIALGNHTMSDMRAAA